MPHENAYDQQGDGARGPLPAPARRWASPLARYWWVVAVIVALAASGAIFSTSNVATTYTGRASLIVASPDRAPEQDAVLVQGYVSYFNDAAYQSQLVQQGAVSGSVTLSARAAASSPILLIEATSTSLDEAASSATTVAQAFQGDINATTDAEQKDQINNLQTQIAQADERGDAATVASLEQQIRAVRQDTTNKLQELQFDGGVSVNSPDRMTNVIFAVFGGLLVGILVALTLARLSRSGRPAAPKRAGVGATGSR